MPSRCMATVAWLLMAAAPATAAPELVSSETKAPGITYSVWKDADLPALIHVARVDLSSSEIDLIATAEDQRGVKPSQFAGTVGATVVINGDYFSPIGYHPAGLARGESETWSGTSDTDVSGFIRFYRDQVRTQASVSAPPEVVPDVAEQTVGVVGGRPLLVESGIAVTSFDCDDLVAMACDPAPRTAVALSEDRNRMWLVVVDGWQAGSIGMSAGQLASFLDAQIGADVALMLDGGSASAMWLAGALVSKPSDGVERPVANHLAVRYGDLPDGTILGHVFEDEIGGTKVDNATIKLDDGRTLAYDGTELWSFSVRPRWACVTASAAGYHSATQCRQVPSDGEVYGSIVLRPNSEFIDAAPGTPDAGPEPDAGPPPPDGGEPAGADGGPPGGDGTGGCGCRSGGDAASALGGVFVLLLALGQLYSARSIERPPRNHV